MTILQAIVYGIIQGVAELLPISSSAHLIAAPQLFGWKDPGLAFDVALHLGTLIAVVAFFWKDWVNLIYSGFRHPRTTEGRLFWFIAAASVPGAFIGWLFEAQAESTFRNLALIGIMLIIMGTVLYAADRKGRKNDTVEDIGFARSLIIGISQAVSIIPGVSRSGITMSAGLFSGLTRESAARFSFLLSTPLIVGAGLLKATDLVHTPVSELPSIIAGVLASALAGFISIRFLLDYLKNKGFGVFALYRLILGIVLIAVYLFRS